MARIQHISARGEKIDFDLLHNNNQYAVAVGNVSMNARGDRLGPGGKIIQKVEDIKVVPQDESYNTNNPNAVAMVSIKDDLSQPKDPAEFLEELAKDHRKEQAKKTASKRKIVDSDK